MGVLGIDERVWSSLPAGSWMTASKVGFACPAQGEFTVCVCSSVPHQTTPTTPRQRRRKSIVPSRQQLEEETALLLRAGVSEQVDL